MKVFFLRRVSDKMTLAVSFKARDINKRMILSLQRHLNYTMANTYSSIFYHIVFSTKNRENWIDIEIENRVWAYVGGIARKHNCTAIQIGGIEDHIHALILSPPRYSPSQIAQFLKGESSKWIHEEFPKMAKFGWQDGYSAFSVSKSVVPKVVEYIKNQREHHQGKRFEDEYLNLLKLHEIDILDEKYIFG